MHKCQRNLKSKGTFLKCFYLNTGNVALAFPLSLFCFCLFDFNGLLFWRNRFGKHYSGSERISSKACSSILFIGSSYSRSLLKSSQLFTSLIYSYLLEQNLALSRGEMSIEVLHLAVKNWQWFPVLSVWNLAQDDWRWHFSLDLAWCPPILTRTASSSLLPLCLRIATVASLVLCAVTPAAFFLTSLDLLQPNRRLCKSQCRHQLIQADSKWDLKRHFRTVLASIVFF